jgi:hypothetical protein
MAIIGLTVAPIELKAIGSYSISRPEAGRLAGLEAQKLFELLASQHSGLLASQPLTI